MMRKSRKTNRNSKRGNSINKKFNAYKKTDKFKITSIFLIFAILSGIVAFGISANQGSGNFVNIDKEVAFGIDVSSHNGKIDWKTVSKNIDFAFIRVACRGYKNGEIFTDKKAHYNLRNAIKHDIPVGVYIYSQATTAEEAVEEAEYTLKIVKRYNITLPIVIDFEYATNKKGDFDGRLYNAKLSKEESTEILNAFCEKIAQRGYTPCIYASSNIYKRHIDTDAIYDKTKIWVADYNKTVTYSGDYDFWQFSNQGSCPGINSKYVDTDYWYIPKENK